MINALFKRFKRGESGQGIVEYGLILALVSVVAIGSLTSIGGGVKNTFAKVIAGGGEVVEEAKGIYSEAEIDALIADGYIPISSNDDLDNLRNGGIQTFGEGTKWGKEYVSGLDKKYIQVGDIDLSGTDNFNPIGTNLNRFIGHFDGGGYTIDNLKIDRSTSEYIGLFGYGQGAIFKNIGLENVDVSGKNYVGGLLGYQTSSSVSNSYVIGAIEGGNNVGGLVGLQISNSSIDNSYNIASVNSVGINVGGLVGMQQTNSSVNKSYATGKVTSTSSHVGGLVGRNHSSSVSNSYATGKVIGVGNVGGLIGYHSSSSLVSNSYATGNVNGANNAGGLVGSDYNSSVNNSFYDTQTTGQTTSVGGTGKTTVEMKQESTYIDWDFLNTWKMDSNQYPTHQ